MLYPKSKQRINQIERDKHACMFINWKTYMNHKAEQPSSQQSHTVSFESFVHPYTESIVTRQMNSFTMQSINWIVCQTMKVLSVKSLGNEITLFALHIIRLLSYIKVPHSCFVYFFSWLFWWKDRDKKCL